MRGDRELVWMLVRQRTQPRDNLISTLLKEQDTVTLAEWREQAIAMEEEIQEEIESRSGDENYPREGMRNA